MRTTIAIDLDDVVFDFNGYIDERFGKRPHQLHLKDTYPEYADEIDRLLVNPDTYRDLSVFKTTKQSLRQLAKQGFYIRAFTSRPYSEEMQNVTWSEIMKHALPIGTVHFGNPKTNAILGVNPILYVDDMPKHLTPLVGSDIKLFLFAQEYNDGFGVGDIQRIQNFSEILDWLQEKDVLVNDTNAKTFC